MTTPKSAFHPYTSEDQFKSSGHYHWCKIMNAKIPEPDSTTLYNELWNMGIVSENRIDQFGVYFHDAQRLFWLYIAGEI